MAGKGLKSRGAIFETEAFAIIELPIPADKTAYEFFGAVHKAKFPSLDYVAWSQDDCKRCAVPGSQAILVARTGTACS